ncbi:U-box domain-containing protein 57-like [Dorcoceras hygrometricum]|uniref:U-box domain-containing protein 57-like n=1 Tax=Dorcoceras hygrometricum TaxID=472368 RepID=A0A2Z7ARR8_9LAMI|nr:U-box domain-containing protein 57-like [Dorcoceras hygrometricum]
MALDENNRVKLVKDKPARTEEDQLGEEKIGSRRSGKNRTRAAGEQEQMRREEEGFDQLSVMNKTARSKTETNWLRKVCNALKDKGRKVQQFQKTFQRLQLCVQRVNLRKGLYITRAEHNHRRRERYGESVVQVQNIKQKNAQHIAVLVASLHAMWQMVCKLVTPEDEEESACWGTRPVLRAVFSLGECCSYSRPRERCLWFQLWRGLLMVIIFGKNGQLSSSELDGTRAVECPS